MRYKLTLVTVGLGVLMFSMLTWDLEVSLRQVRKEAVAAAARSTARAFALACSTALVERNLAELSRKANEIVDGRDVLGASVASTTGAVLVRSEKGLFRGLPRVDVSAAVETGGVRVGTVSLSLRPKSAGGAVLFVHWWLWAVAGLLLAILALMIWTMMSRLFASLTALSRDAAKIVAGLPGDKLEPYAEKEVREVAREFDAMAKSMHLAQTEIEQRNRELIQRVDERSQQLRFRKEELRMRSAVLRSIAQHLPLEQTLELIVNNAARLLDASNCFLLLLDNPSQQLVGVARSGGKTEEFKGYSVGVEQDIDVIRAVKSRQPYLVRDARYDKAVNRQMAERVGGKAAMFLPLIANEEVIGAMVLDDTRAPRYYTEEEVERGLAIANEAAIAIGYATLARELSLAKAAMERSEQKYRRLVENANDAILVLDANGKVVSANRQAHTMLGLDSTSGQLVGRPLATLVIPEEADGVVALFAEILEKGAVSNRRLVFPGPDGNAVIGEGNFVATREERGVTVQGVLRDMTQQEALESRLILSEKLAALGQLSAGIAHEIRNPLHAISTAAYYLCDAIGDEKLDRAELQQNLELIKRNVSRTQEIISDVLKFARPSGGAKVPADLNSIALEALGMLEKQCQAQSITVVTDFQPLPRILCTPEAIQQALVNIIINAVHAMPQGGTLRLRTRNGSRRGVAVEIGDTGCGIPTQQLQRVFDPFYTTKEPGKGTGLGLSIARSAVEANGGRVSVFSEQGVGSVFTIFFEGM